MAEESIRLLVVEGDAADAQRIGQTLAETLASGYDVESASTLGECLQWLDRTAFDAILLDLELPDSRGLATLDTVISAASGTPVLVLTPPAEVYLGVKALGAGAQEYLVKGEIVGTMLARVIRHAVARADSERALRETEERFRQLAERIRFQSTLLEAVGEAVVAADPGGGIIYWNRYAERLFGWTAAEVMGRPLLGVIRTPEPLPTLERRLAEILAGRTWTGELSFTRRDGTDFPAFVTGAPICDEADEVAGVLGVIADLTEVKRLEEQLQQAQRLEAVGRLAGGVAHDFNNILTGIQECTYFLLEDLSPDHPLRAEAEQIRKAADRAAALTRQLLAFSRKQVLQPRVLDLGSVVAGMEKLLVRVIGEDIELGFSRDPRLWRVRADSAQIEQVVMNLVVNARDAMPSGGQVTLEVRNVDDHRLSGPDGSWSCPCVMLRVSDTGSGIGADELSQIFEPYFTTKEPGHGTGLGLSTVYGIVTQSGGQIDVHSELDRGTTFEVYLPRVDEAEQASGGASPIEMSSRGETIMLVEDDDDLRSAGVQALHRLGYRVLHARSGDEAIWLGERYSGTIDLILTDVLMPQMSGEELAERMMDKRPDLRVLYCSGYSREVIGTHGVTEESQGILEKPFSPTQLATRVSEVLNAPAESRTTKRSANESAASLDP